MYVFLVLILFLSACNNSMQYTKPGVVIPGEFAKDFYACRDKAVAQKFNQVYTLKHDFFTYEPAPVDELMLDTCIRQHGWTRVGAE